MTRVGVPTSFPAEQKPSDHTAQCRTLLCCCRALWLGLTDGSYISLSFPRPSSTLTSKFLRGFLANSLIWRHLLPSGLILVPSLPHFALRSALVAIEVVMSGPGREFIGRDKCFMELFSVIMLGAGVSHTTSSRRSSLRPATTQGS